jgi:hypothetical protein
MGLESDRVEDLCIWREWVNDLCESVTRLAKDRYKDKVMALPLPPSTRPASIAPKASASSSSSGGGRMPSTKTTTRSTPY